MRLLTTTIHLVTNPAGPDITNSPSGTRPRPARNPTNSTPMQRHSRTTAHSVRVSAEQGVPGGIPEGQRVPTRTTRFAAHGGPCTGRRPPPHPQSYPQILWICRWTTPCPCADARRACAHRRGAKNHRSVIPAIGVCRRRRSRRTEGASAMVCGGRRGEKAHATTRQAGTVPQGFALPPSVRVTPDGVAAVWASRNRHHCSSASGGPSPRGAPHAPPGRSTRRTAHQHRRPTAPTPRAPHPQARNAQSPPARNAQPPRTPQHRQTQWAPPIRRGPLRCTCSALYLFRACSYSAFFLLRGCSHSVRLPRASTAATA